MNIRPYRSESTPAEIDIRSLIRPTLNAPKPRPIMFRTKRFIEAITALISTGARDCRIAKLTPMYTPPRAAGPVNQNIAQKGSILW